MRRRALFALLLSLGCGDDGPSYAGVEFDVISAPPLPVMIGSEALTLVAGLAVKVSATPLSSGHEYPKKTRLALRSADPSLLAVFASEARSDFVLVGLREGTTCLEVRIDGEVEECVPTSVQPPTR